MSYGKNEQIRILWLNVNAGGGVVMEFDLYIVDTPFWNSVTLEPFY